MDQQAHKNDQATPVSTGDERKAASTSKRRLLKAGLIGGPLLVTLRSRPAYSLQSLGSLGIPYGMYDPATGEPVDSNGNVLDDPTRRSGN